MPEYKHAILILAALLLFRTTHAQKTVAASTHLNVLYTNISNELDIVSEDISRKNLEVHCDGFKIKDSIGHFYFYSEKLPAKRQVYIFIRDRTKQSKTWTDSILFRVKHVPTPNAQLGTLEPGTYHKGELMLQDKLYAYLDGFIYDGLKYTVKNYRILYFDMITLDFIDITVQGNRTTELKLALRHAISGSTIILHDIKAVMYKNGRPGTDEIKLPPITYNVKGEIDRTLLAEFYSGKNKIFVPTAAMPGKFDSDQIRMLKKISGLDTILLAERQDSAGNLIWFKRYYDSAKTILQLEVQRLSDTSFYLKRYNTAEICISEGTSMAPQFEIIDLTSYTQWINSYNYLNHPDSIQKSKFYFRVIPYYQNVIPSGEWKFYYNTGQLYASGHYQPGKPVIVQPLDEDEGPFVWVCGTGMEFEHCKMTGTWKFYDIHGKMIYEENILTSE